MHQGCSNSLAGPAGHKVSASSRPPIVTKKAKRERRSRRRRAPPSQPSTPTAAFPGAPNARAPSLTPCWVQRPSSSMAWYCPAPRPQKKPPLTPAALQGGDRSKYSSRIKNQGRAAPTTTSSTTCAHHGLSTLYKSHWHAPWWCSRGLKFWESFLKKPKAPFHTCRKTLFLFTCQNRCHQSWQHGPGGTSQEGRTLVYRARHT